MNVEYLLSGHYFTLATQLEVMASKSFSGLNASQ